MAAWRLLARAGFLTTWCFAWGAAVLVGRLTKARGRSRSGFTRRLCLPCIYGVREIRRRIVPVRFVRLVSSWDRARRIFVPVPTASSAAAAAPAAAPSAAPSAAASTMRGGSTVAVAPASAPAARDTGDGLGLTTRRHYTPSMRSPTRCPPGPTTHRCRVPLAGRACRLRRACSARTVGSAALAPPKCVQRGMLLGQRLRDAPLPLLRSAEAFPGSAGTGGVPVDRFRWLRWGCLSAAPPPAH